jgi:hypothetical protein
MIDRLLKEFAGLFIQEHLGEIYLPNMNHGKQSKRLI